MINNPKDIEKILKKLEKITLEELDEAIENVDKEYTEIDYEYQNIYNIKNEEETYYLTEDYYDFYLHMSKSDKSKKRDAIKENIEVAA